MFEGKDYHKWLLGFSFTQTRVTCNKMGNPNFLLSVHIQKNMLHQLKYKNANFSEANVSFIDIQQKNISDNFFVMKKTVLFL